MVHEEPGLGPLHTGIVIHSFIVQSPIHCGWAVCDPIWNTWDPIPSHLLKDIITVIFPSLSKIINISPSIVIIYISILNKLVFSLLKGKKTGKQNTINLSSSFNYSSYVWVLFNLKNPYNNFLLFSSLGGRPGFDLWVRQIPWRRNWQPTPVFLPAESHWQRSPEDYSPWGYKVGHGWEMNTHTCSSLFQFLFFHPLMNITPLGFVPSPPAKLFWSAPIW